MLRSLLRKWKWTLVAMVYLVAEYRSYVRQRRRFVHFEQLRVRMSPTERNATRDVMARLSHDLARLRDLDLRPHSCLRTSQNILEASKIPDDTEPRRPAHEMTLFNTSLYWQYIPLPVWYGICLVRFVGEAYLRGRGFARQWHSTPDGYYAVWSRHVPKTRPVVLFPGVGLGAVPYVEIAARLGRTVYMIEIPNLGYSTPLSDRQCTASTLYDVITSHVACPDILAHSMGTVMATMFLNEQRARGVSVTQQQHVVLCDGFTHLVDVPLSWVGAFMGWSDYRQVCRDKGAYVYLMWAIILVMLHNVEVQAWTKRFCFPHTSLLYHPYPNTHILHLYGSKDPLMDARYISEKHQDESIVLVEDGANHGDILFHPSFRKRMWTTICAWLQPD